MKQEGEGYFVDIVRIECDRIFRVSLDWEVVMLESVLHSLSTNDAVRSAFDRGFAGLEFWYSSIPAGYIDTM